MRYDVKFRLGRANDDKDGGILHTPDGKKIALRFEDIKILADVLAVVLALVLVLAVVLVVVLVLVLMLV